MKVSARAFLFLMAMGFLLAPLPAFAQYVEVSPGDLYLPPGQPSCAWITVYGASNMYVDFEFLLPDQTYGWWNWVPLDGNGQFYFCVDGWQEGQYVITYVEDSYQPWIGGPVWAPFTVSSPPPPVSVSPADLYKPPGNPSCTLITVSGWADRVVDFGVVRPSQAFEWWNEVPLDSNGQKYGCIDGSWEEGTWVITWVRDHYQPSIGGAVNAPFTIHPAPSQAVTGYIDGISQQGPDFYLVGWACAQTSPNSIDVHVYAGGPAGGGWGTFATAATANVPSEPAVAAACNSTGSNYRFWILLSESVRQQFGGLRIWVHGISPFGLGNLLIGNSGLFTVPPLAQQIQWKKDHIYTPGGAEVITATPQ